MLSIAAKAGKVQSGGFLTEKAIQEGVAYFGVFGYSASFCIGKERLLFVCGITG